MEANFSRRWGWYGAMDALSGGDVLKQDAISKSGLYQCLMKLDYEQDKSKLLESKTKRR